MARTIASLVLAVLPFSSPAFALWPQPTTLNTGSTALKLSSSFQIISWLDAPGDLEAAITRTQAHLVNDKLQRLVPDRGASDAETIRDASSLPSLQLSVSDEAASIASEAVKPIGERSESYSLTIPADGEAATLSANSTLGLFRGLTTFEQIWYEWQGNIYTLSAPFNIVDSPKYPYRGLALDTARNYFPVSDIKRTLDAMSWVKMTTFHWHIVDSQSFPLVVPGFEEISAEGAYDNASVYTVEDVKDLVAYANARGIDVVGEIDTPGHTSAISKSHPEHIACADATPWNNFALEPPAGQLRFASESTTKFTSSFLLAASSLFTSHYFSTGGDEINTNCYAQDSQTQIDLASQGKTFKQALDTFVQSIHAALRKAGKTPVVYQEMVLDHDVTLGNDTIVTVWMSSAHAAAVTRKGFRLIHAASDYFYLDCGAGVWVANYPHINYWCDPFKTWLKSYTFDPVADMTSDEASLVLGGQHLLWTEQAGPQNLDPIVWPRAASSAEVFWSGPGGDVAAAFHRLHDISFRFRQRGVNTISLQPLWCALRPGACDFPTSLRDPVVTTTLPPPPPPPPVVPPPDSQAVPPVQSDLGSALRAIEVAQDTLISLSLALVIEGIFLACQAVINQRRVVLQNDSLSYV